jgi:hypothetical protein
VSRLPEHSALILFGRPLTPAEWATVYDALRRIPHAQAIEINTGPPPVEPIPLP